MIHGGTRFNIILGEVALEGTVRTYDRAVRDTVERRIRESSTTFSRRLIGLPATLRFGIRLRLFRLSWVVRRRKCQDRIHTLLKPPRLLHGLGD